VIGPDVVREATGLNLAMAGYPALGLATSDHDERILTFVGAAKYVEAVNDNPRIAGAFVRKAEADALRDGIERIVVDDPVWTFFSVVDFRGRTRAWAETVVHATATVHPAAVVAPKGVTVAEGAVIEARAVVMPGVTVGPGTLIRPGAVLGVDGYEHKSTSRGVLSVAHDGEALIGRDCEVGVNTFVAKGFSYRPTVIGDESKLDALIHYAHGVQCGHRCLIVANAMIGGNVTMGDRVWVGPSASIANRLVLGDDAFVTMGSVVTRDVAPGGKVTGNFAIPHATFLANLKKSLSAE
jgi:UDP-3-O-[3-hydroxymyristoyl] glucosamine N-acyltransferase